ncbi:MAG: imidazoleglycerol-phosphate dehydratase HisB [Clostridia bacterium]|nr:imidazoleglycerol-phosphate dehydratase HisB [Clostridia bacterium]
MRFAKAERKTKETDIQLVINLDGTGTHDVDTGCGFFNHMLELFAVHGQFDLAVKCKGDTDVDFHHSAEDIGIVLGSAIFDALGDKRGIKRYASRSLPMDEAWIDIALDISGRSYFAHDFRFPTEKVGEFDSELTAEFLAALCRTMGLTLHVRQNRGENTHHIIEAVFKGLARALKEAVTIDKERENEIPSSKGVL